MKTVILIKDWATYTKGTRFTVVDRIPCNPVTDANGKTTTPINLRVVLESDNAIDLFFHRTIPAEYTIEAYRVGEPLTVERNQGDRDATVLAVDGLRMLIEYEMPNGSTSLNEVSMEDPGGRYRSVAYRSLSKRWQTILIENEVTWIGCPQGGLRSKPYLPQPAVLFGATVLAQ